MLAYLILDTVFDTTLWVAKKTCSLGYNAIYYLIYGSENNPEIKMIEYPNKDLDLKLIDNIKEIMEENKKLKEELKILKSSESDL